MVGAASQRLGPLESSDCAPRQARFVKDQFDEITVALVDSKGCAKVRQKISGTFRSPVVAKPDLATSLAGPALRLLKKGGSC